MFVYTVYGTSVITRRRSAGAVRAVSPVAAARPADRAWVVRGRDRAAAATPAGKAAATEPVQAAAPIQKPDVTAVGAGVSVPGTVSVRCDTATYLALRNEREIPEPDFSGALHRLRQR